MEIDNCPPLDESLVRWLEQVFPDRLPTGCDITMAEVNHRIGQVSVVKRLRSEYERQQDTEQE